MGQTDIPLNERGRQQAHEAGKILASLTIATLCYSPLERAKETAQIVGDQCPCSLFPVDGFKERFWGSLEGKRMTHEELSEIEHRLPDGAEGKETFRNRVIGAFQDASTYPEPILFVSHGGVFEIICSELNLVPPTLSNTGIVHFFQELGKWRMEIIEH